MDHIGIDVHKRESQIYILTEEGEIIEQRIPLGCSTGEAFPSHLLSAYFVLGERGSCGTL
jgi:hypothetical protein